MRRRQSSFGLLLTALLVASPAFGVQQQGGTGGGGGEGAKPAAKPRPQLPEVDSARPEPATAPDSARGEAPRAEAEERVIPEAGQTTWRMWLARNFHAFEAPPLDGNEARAGAPGHSIDPALRSKARALYERDVDALLGLLLKDPDDRVRGAAALSLARSGLAQEASDGEAILRLLGDDQRRVRDQALLAASLADGTAARYHVLRFAAAAEEPNSAPTESERVRTRALAAVFASLHGEPALLQLVRDLAGDKRLSTPLRALVVQALGLAGNKDASPTLVAIARDRAESALVRAAAVAALGSLGDRACAPLIVGLLEDRDHDSEVRASAALAVGLLVTPGDADLVRTLVRAHRREGNATVARFLLLSLGRIGGASAQVEIERVLERESAEERVFAELALGLLARSSGAVQNIAPLLDMLRTVRVQDERCALLCALGLSAVPQALETIAEETLKAPAPEVRRSGIAALTMIGLPGCVPMFQKLLLDDESPEVRIQAARALARLDPSSASTLIHALGSSRSRGTSERAALILSLGFTRDPTTLEPLLDLLRERGHSSQEREAATLALGLVYDRHLAPPTSRLGEWKSFLRESPEISSLLALAE